MPGLKFLKSLITLGAYFYCLPLLAMPKLYLTLEFPQAPERENPEHTEGGGRRTGKCTNQDSPPLTALAPQEMVTTQTSQASFFWYIPETKAQQAEFILLDSTGEEVYNYSFKPPQQAGIVQLTLPENFVLEANKTYKWQFSLVCNPLDPSQNEYVIGMLQRSDLTPAEEEQLKKATDPLEKAQLYAQFAIWNETIILAAQLRPQAPQEWEELLKSIGITFEPIINAPIVNIEDEGMGLKK